MKGTLFNQTIVSGIDPVIIKLMLMNRFTETTPTTGTVCQVETTDFFYCFSVVLY